MKVNIFTSYFAKIAKREKHINDCYVQICRSVMPFHANLVDEDWSGFAPICSELEDYEDELLSFPQLLQEFADFLSEDGWDLSGKEQEYDEVNVFLLCYENLDSKYTAKDEERARKKGVYDIKAGEFKKCHRTILAKVMNERFGFNIQEFKD